MAGRNVEPPVRVVGEDDMVPEAWVGNDVTTVGQWGHREYESGLTTGYENGRKQVIVKIRQLAAEWYIAGKDDKANMLRDLAATLEKEKWPG